MPGHVSAGDQVGVATEHIDRLMFEFAIEYGAMPATLMYRGCAKSTCT
jgi:methionyl aminopeptidase